MSRPDAREAILGRLAASRRVAAPPVAPDRLWKAPDLDPAKRVDLIAGRLEAMRATVRRAPEKKWLEALAQLLAEKSPARLAFGPGAWFAKDLAAWLRKSGAPEAVPYLEDAESFRDTLFTVEASVTSALAGIAENGTLVISPGPDEPRLLSIVPPLHVAMVRASDIHDTFAGAIEALKLASGMPANLVLVSGPSKTADIELTLAFGVHGPRELAVLILE